MLKSMRLFPLLVAGATLFGCARTEPLYCGQEGDLPCPEDMLCIDGRCQPGAGATCSSGLTNCNGDCVDITSAHDNCGICGHACTAAQVCSAGACASGCS